MSASPRVPHTLDARQLGASLAVTLLALALPACMPDFDALSEGYPSMACVWSPVESATTTVPEGQCWRVIALSSDLRLRLEGESCDAARECLTAEAGETVLPLARFMASATNDDLEVVVWPCDELASACAE
jgi:hypothetical protein